MKRSGLIFLSLLMIPLSGICALMLPATFGLSRQSGALHPGLARTASLGDLTLTGVYPRIITPNGDGYNDKARFEFDNPEELPITGTVYDLSGARVSDLKPGSDPTSVLLWDGKDTDGKVVAGGIYIYQIDFEGKHATGTVVVAR